MNSKSYWILFGFICLTEVYADTIPQPNIAPPVPGLPPNTDPTRPTLKTTTGIPGPPMFSNSYLPAVMQAVAYYVELIQYEVINPTTVEPPFTVQQTNGVMADTPTTHKTTLVSTTSTTTTTTRKPPTTTPRPTTILTTTRRPTTTKTTTQKPTTINLFEHTTPAHRPGYFSPEKPILITTDVDQEIDKPIDSNNQVTKPTISNSKPQTGSLALLSISQSQFFEWFLQMKAKEIPDISEYDLQYLHQLPSGLLQDILYERYQQPALLDMDNVNEFLKIYDDYYGRKQPLTGNKKIPPTRPYVQFLMLYDLLKREAKVLNFHKFEGYSRNMLHELNQTSYGSAERQLYTLMYRMLTRKDVDKTDITNRVTTIMKDLADPYSVTAMTLRYIPPLTFLP